MTRASHYNLGLKEGGDWSQFPTKFSSRFTLIKTKQRDYGEEKITQEEIDRCLAAYLSENKTGKTCYSNPNSPCTKRNKHQPQSSEIHDEKSSKVIKLLCD